MGKNKFWLCDPAWAPQVSGHSQEEGRKPARLGAGPDSHGNENTTLVANLQSPQECLALAKWVSAASRENSLSSPSPSVTSPFSNKPWVLAFVLGCCLYSIAEYIKSIY